jgi:hypothetical protein
MARPSTALIRALRATADRLSSGAPYQWGHPGACNCGHLAQTATRRSREELLAAARSRPGDWGQMAVEACPASGLPIDGVIEELLALGLDRSDIGNLEDLSDRRVLATLPLAQREGLRRNRRADVVLYMRAWAALLEIEADAPAVEQAAVPARGPEALARR